MHHFTLKTITIYQARLGATNIAKVERKKRVAHFPQIVERFDDPDAPRGSVNLDLASAVSAMPELFAQAMIAHLEAGDCFV